MNKWFLKEWEAILTCLENNRKTLELLELNPYHPSFRLHSLQGQEIPGWFNALAARKGLGLGKITHHLYPAQGFLHKELLEIGAQVSVFPFDFDQTLGLPVVSTNFH